MESGFDGPSFRHQFSWLAYLLPYVEQSSVYARINFNAVDPSLSAHQNPAFQPAGANWVPVYICPSDPVGRRNPDWAPTNYLGNQGTLCAARDKSGNGLFGHNSWIRLEEIIDGTSQTIAVGEILKGDYDPSTIADNYIFVRGAADAQNVDTCQSFPPNASDLGGVWLGGNPQNNMFSTNRPPNDRRFDCIAPSYGCTNIAARSQHPGGAMVLFADGSVTFMSEAVAPATYQALGTRNGRDVAGPH
jgi:prepilin-type processing-associated H-X9-DG protein